MLEAKQESGQWTRPTTSDEGRVIALIGADGAGKSTVYKEIGSWLANDHDVVSIYFGSGDGPVSLPRRLLQIVAGTHRRLSRAWNRVRLRRTNEKPTAARHKVTGDRNQPFLRRLRCWLNCLLIARERSRNLKHMLHARQRGAIVITDRFPQTQVLGMMDCPRLCRWRTHTSRLVRRLANWEFSVYQFAEQNPPDIVIHLAVSAPVAMQRVSNHTTDALAERIRSIEKLAFPSSTSVIRVDADQALDYVLLQVKAALSETLSR